jgi:hypothetical protein
MDVAYVWDGVVARVSNCTPNADLPGFPDDDDLLVTRALATDLRRHQLADKPFDGSPDRDVGGKPTRTAGAPRAPRSGSGAEAPLRCVGSAGRR